MTAVDKPGDRAQPALRPQPADEGRHDPKPGLLWNESWYFDAVDDSETLGVYIRLGLLPNQGCCFYAASIVRPGLPTLMIVDERAPLAPNGITAEAVSTETLHATQECIAPLTDYNVTLAATAQAYADHSAPLRGEVGEPVAVELELRWHTDGIPYAWSATTRYEIPCRVTGVIRIGDRQHTFGGPGQRDHSWGIRDWWAHDWMWSAFHLNDGTRVHVVMVPEIPGMVVGYVQQGDSLSELSSGTCTQTIGTDGLIRTAQIALPDLNVVLDIEPTAFGALRMVSPDDRVSHFPRAMARVRSTDGRTGVGWIEWNRNQ
ncbi:hypothetical protein BH09ACT8_BH09ACT8_32720 [soil metagenome]